MCTILKLILHFCEKSPHTLQDFQMLKKKIKSRESFVLNDEFYPACFEKIICETAHSRSRIFFPIYSEKKKIFSPKFIIARKFLYMTRCRSNYQNYL